MHESTTDGDVVLLYCCKATVLDSSCDFDWRALHSLRILPISMTSSPISEFLLT